MTVNVNVTDKSGQPVLEWRREIPLFDHMDFVDKPDLGLPTDFHILGEWESTLKDDPGDPPTALTIETAELTALVEDHRQFKYLAYDIEELGPADDAIAIQYVQLAQSAAPDSLVGWWNLGPSSIVDTQGSPFDLDAWQTEFNQRQAFVDACDFCVLGGYFKSTDTIETWRKRTILRVAEARRLFKGKPLIFGTSPHFFDLGKPWPFMSGAMLSEALDIIEDQRVEGIALWSFEGTGKLQTWDPNWDWISAIG